MSVTVQAPLSSEVPQRQPQGLTGEEAQRRLAQFGPNDPAPPQRRTLLSQIARLFGNPLVVILLIAASVAGATGDVVNAAIIVVIVLLSVSLDFVQTYRSQKAVEELSRSVAPMATALRDGEWKQTLRRELVPGDLVRLEAGDLVPADARLLTADNLHVQQAALTGESLPVEKEATHENTEANSPDAPDRVFLGTSVVSGTATAEIVATGGKTLFGDIATRLTTRSPETEFERGTRRFGYLIMQTVFFLVLFVLLVNVTLHRNPLESLLFAVALAVGLTPEFLPMITTVTLTQGAVRMARRHVAVKHLESLQNFGSMDVLCSDKTGTLTGGAMSLDASLDPFGAPSPRAFALAYLNSRYESGISNPLDEAILHQPAPEAGKDSRKVDEIPFDFERRRVSVVVADGTTNLLVTKGAPESILSLCTAYEADGKEIAIDADAKKRCEAAYQTLCDQGLRALAVAFRSLPAKAKYGKEEEAELTLAGFVTFSDPPLKEAAHALKALRHDGVLVKILTGDSERVARHVCEQVGLEAGEIVLGDDLEKMSDTALEHIVENTVVFARVSPAQKNRIILALKRRSHVVGFLGDGINDTPSLHAADVGISVATATDVAKEAADIILLKPGLNVLHSGILEGRKAFGNVMKYLLMGTSSNFGNMLSMAGAALFLPFLPMLPTQILLNSFLYDLAQVTIPTDNVDSSFIRKPRRWDISVIRQFMLVLGPISSLYDFLTFFVLLRVFHAHEALFHTGWFVESLATQTLVLFVIRTMGNPLHSRPSRPLTITVLLIVLLGIALPYTPLAAPLHFLPLPGGFLIFLVVATLTYLGLVEIVKRWLMRRRLQV